jgi:predicted acylesterase/phospholipase RssA
MTAAAMFWAPIAESAIQAEQSQIALPDVTSCGENQRLQLTLGLPADYQSPQTPTSIQPRTGFETVCVSIAKGNPYQLLSWLENSHLQVVVLPEFAVAMLEWSSPESFAKDYLVLRQSPFQLLPLQQTRLELTATDGTARGADAFKPLFARIEGQGEVPRVMLPHHLSMSVDQLVSHAVVHADLRGLTGDDRKRFFTRLVAAISFREPYSLEALQAKVDFEYVPVQTNATDKSNTEVVDRDVIVIHRHIVSSYPELQQKLAQVKEATVQADVKNAFRWLKGSTDQVLKTFYADNYALDQYGSVSRHYFRFTIPELWGLLDEGAPAKTSQDDDGGLALVLTGGGVKAAYQTRLVERLYETGKLRNVRSNELPPGGTASTQQVNFVIGTSGGALLGIFVSALDDNATRKFAQEEDASLTAALWGKAGQRIRSWDIFPPWDLMRYASVVVCLLLLLIVGSLAIYVEAKKYQFARAIAGQKVDDRLAALPRRERWPLGSMPWIVLLILAPIIIVSVARNRGLEHVPEWSGVLYLVMVLIAIDVDQRFSPTGHPFNLLRARPSITSVALFLAGVATIWTSLGYEWHDTGCDDWSRGVVWCSAGFVMLALALHRYLAHQKDLLAVGSPKPLVSALALAASVVLATYLVLLAGTGAGLVAILELTATFWYWTIAAAVGFSLILMFLAARRGDESPRFPAVNRGVRLLFSRHPTRHWIVGRRRLARFVFFGLAGWAWWNLAVAPGLYGNCDARDYFNHTYNRFASQIGSSSDTLPLSVPFVITATSLEKSEERYFLFPRFGGDERSGIQSDVWFRLVSDPRWLVVRNFKKSDLKSVAFASGSPFPIFSSHEVAIQSLQLDERFIDGGFAHNRPLDAARALGARRVLVLNSSPLTSRGAVGRCLFGELACNLPKLVPYLWERSQAEDNLSSMTMFVASIYPTPIEGRAWPGLADFHGDVVDELVLVADADEARRIGVVESWGAPRLGNVQRLNIDISSVERSLRSAE